MSADKPTPVVTLLLLAANIGAAFLLFAQPDLLYTYGFVPGKPSAVSAITSIFLHANLLHLLGNMVFLAAAGPATESAVGALRFFGCFLASGLAGVAAHWMIVPSTAPPLIGASGAVAGIVALASIRFFKTKVPLAPGLSIPVPAVAVAWLALQVAGGMVRLGEDPGGTAYWSHIGGFLAGALIALAFRTDKAAVQAASSQVIGEMAARSPAAALAAADEHLKLHPADYRAWVEKGEAHARLGETGSAGEAFLAAIDAAPPTSHGNILERAAEAGCLNALPSMRRTALAAKLRSGKEELAVALYESVVAGPEDDTQRPDAILALAELRREADPDGARRLVSELLRVYPLHPAAEVAKAKGWTG